MNTLHLTKLGTNQTEVRYGNNHILFSYSTPVAFSDNAGNCFVTSKFWSKTTSKHINSWLAGRKATKVSQDTIDNLIK